MFRLYTFWIFTFLGLGLPYRVWFSRHCDNLKVTVVKETFAEKPASSFSSWFTSSSSPVASNKPLVSLDTAGNALFRQQMEELLLYSKPETQQEQTHTEDSATEQQSSTLESLADPPPVVAEPTPPGSDENSLPYITGSEEALDASVSSDQNDAFSGSTELLDSTEAESSSPSVDLQDIDAQNYDGQ